MSKDLVTIQPVPTSEVSTYYVYYENGKLLGELSQLEDGFYHWWPLKDFGSGCWSSEVLKAIAKMLDELNAPWERQINEYFDNCRVQ